MTVLAGTPAQRERITEIKCDACGRIDRDVMEIQEYLRYRDTAGYNGRGADGKPNDGDELELDLCQECKWTLLGKYIRIVDRRFDREFRGSEI